LHPSLPPSLCPCNCNQFVQCLLNFNIIQLISGLPLAPHNSFLLLTPEFLCQPGCEFPWRQEAGISTAGACTECQCWLHIFLHQHHTTCLIQLRCKRARKPNAFCKSLQAFRTASPSVKLENKTTSLRHWTNQLRGRSYKRAFIRTKRHFCTHSLLYDSMTPYQEHFETSVCQGSSSACRGCSRPNLIELEATKSLPCDCKHMQTLLCQACSNIPSLRQYSSKLRRVFSSIQAVANLLNRVLLYVAA
jgi:hypothetical protein